MRRLLLLTGVIAVTACNTETEPDRSNSTLRPSSVEDSGDRVANARRAKLDQLKKDFSAKGLTYPPARLYLRAIKSDAELEVWVGGANEAYKLFRTYPIAKMSGKLGPKRKEGDYQVPEGFYFIDRFNPKSQFHLSLGLNYPNVYDRAQALEGKPGGDIFIHGNQVSIGCMAMTDDKIQEIYLIALDAKTKPIPVHVFPSRLEGKGYSRLIEEHPKFAPLWKSMAPAWQQFERTRKVPRVQTTAKGYRVLQ